LLSWFYNKKSSFFYYYCPPFQWRTTSVLILQRRKNKSNLDQEDRKRVLQMCIFQSELMLLWELGKEGINWKRDGSGRLSFNIKTGFGFPCKKEGEAESCWTLTQQFACQAGSSFLLVCKSSFFLSLFFFFLPPKLANFCPQD
jgi:hypothetical protein